MNDQDTRVDRDDGASHDGEGMPTDLEALEKLDDWELAEGETDPRGYDLMTMETRHIAEPVTHTRVLAETRDEVAVEHAPQRR
jgi:hypothetical protein